MKFVDLLYTNTCTRVYPVISISGVIFLALCLRMSFHSYLYFCNLGQPGMTPAAPASPAATDAPINTSAPLLALESNRFIHWSVNSKCPQPHLSLFWPVSITASLPDPSFEKKRLLLQVRAHTSWREHSWQRLSLCCIVACDESAKSQG